MSAAVDWFRKDCAAMKSRALGLVTPALLSPVTVKIPGIGKKVPLEELATVGVREGTTLLITVLQPPVRFFRLNFLLGMNGSPLLVSRT